MKNEDNELLEKLDLVYKWCSRERVWRLCAVLMGFSVVIDCLPYHYWTSWLEKFFSYQISNVIAIVVIIWTAMVTLTMYYLGKTEERFYGIRMIDVMKMKWGFRHLFCLALLVLLELLVLILSAIGDLKITGVIVAVLQFCTMIYLFLMICIEMGRHGLLKPIKDEIIEHSNYFLEKNRKENGSLLVIRMIENMEFANKEEENDLLGLLREVQWELPPDVSLKFSYQIASSLWERSGKKEIALNITKEWYYETTLDVKKGILMALIERLNPEIFREFQRMLDIEKEHRKEVYAWSFAYNLFLQIHEGEGWRKEFTERLCSMIFNKLGAMDAAVTLKYWDQILKDAGMPVDEYYRDICKYIYENEQEGWR